MTSKLKTFGLATVAVLAMSAMLASAAQAQFTTNAAPTTVTATSALGNGVFTIDGQKAECAAHFEGTFGSTSQASITLIATYTNCKAFTFASATVDMNGCDYVLYSNENSDVACPEGKGPIKITAGNCEVQVGAQTGLSEVHLTNFHPHFDMRAEVGGIAVTTTKDGFLCPLIGTGKRTATYVHKQVVHVVAVSGGTTVSVD